MTDLNTVKGLIKHFYDGPCWPYVAMKSSIIVHEDTLYVNHEDTFIPAAIRVSSGIFIINTGCTIKTGGTLERAIKTLNECITDGGTYIRVYETTIDTVERPGIYPDITSTIDLIILESAEGIAKAAILIEASSTEAEHDRLTGVVDDLSREMEYANVLKGKIEDFNKYLRYKELLGIDKIFNDAIKEGGISEETYNRLQDTFDELKAHANETTEFIKHLTSI